MCGLAAFFSVLEPGHTRDSVDHMLQEQAHRGPDSAGIWCGTVHGIHVGLGLCRLKILDLSDAANQPMVSEDGRFVLVYNGEIYNYVELRSQLIASGVRFRTSGDTEVLLQALIVWGTAAFSRLNGMWALVLLDQVNGEILLSRDRFGVKPLYTHSDESGVFVSSEIKGILKVANKRFQVNTNAVNAYLSQNLLCTGRETFFAGVEEFPAGSMARLSVEDLGKKRFDPQRYWTIPTTLSCDLNESTLIELVRTSFIDSVRLRLRSDVPVGVLLSGGIDSSAIAAAVQYLNPARDDLKLISAVGEGNTADEEPFIDAMAGHLNHRVEKVVLNYSNAKAFDLISKVSWFNDEPLGSFSTIAHYLLMERAKDLGITVLLSGQGSDEILCGYKKYLGFYIQELVASGKWLTSARIMNAFLSKGTVLSQINYQEAKRYLPRWLRFPEIDIRGPALLEIDERIQVGLNGGGLIGRQVVDLERLSVPALLHYEDRMSMAMAREIRLPFLDYRLVSLVVPLPIEFKLRAGWTKWIFRRAMQTLLPESIAWRKDKQPFIVPQNEWLRFELKSNVLKLLQGEWVTEHLGLVDRRKFRMRYDEYLRQPSKNGRLSFKDVFSPIALELWARRFENYLCPVS